MRLNGKQLHCDHLRLLAFCFILLNQNFTSQSPPSFTPMCELCTGTPAIIRSIRPNSALAFPLPHHCRNHSPSVLFSALQGKRQNSPLSLPGWPWGHSSTHLLLQLHPAQCRLLLCTPFQQLCGSLHKELSGVNTYQQSRNKVCLQKQATSNKSRRVSWRLRE